MTIMHRITIQRVNKHSFVPKSAQLRQWAKHIIGNVEKKPARYKKSSYFEVTLRIVNKEEISELNNRFRHKTGPTNVLSFPYELPATIPLKIQPLGDIVICADVVNQEAEQQHKLVAAHWAHIITHGILHLCGFDHETIAEAEIMEAAEIKILTSMGFTNPYL